MKKLIFTMFVAGITVDARGYLNEMRVEEPEKRPIVSYCKSLVEYGYTPQEVRGCVKQRKRAEEREVQRERTRKWCLRRHLGNYEKIVTCLSTQQ